jgi:hypothetical protein
LVKDLNDNDEALRDLAAALRRFEPDEVQVSLPVRPPAETWVEPPDDEGLMRATVILSEAARLIHPVHGDFDLSDDLDVVDAVLALITRHPLREDELTRALYRWAPGGVSAALAELLASGRVQTVTRLGHRFWSAAGAKYARGKGRRAAGGRGG